MSVLYRGRAGYAFRKMVLTACLACPASGWGGVAQPAATAAKKTLATGGEDPDRERLLRMLRARGIDPAVLGTMGDARLPAGGNFLDISVNGEFKGAWQVTINPQGALCFTPELLSQLKLKAAAHAADTPCFDWAQQDSAVSVTFDTKKLAASIVVPQSEVLDDSTMATSAWGGVGSQLNFNFYSTTSRNYGYQNRFSYLMLQDGVNIANWMLRGRQQVSEYDGVLSATAGSLYAERPLVRWQKRLQLGQISVNNTLFSLGEIAGVQLFPDDRLQGVQQEGGVVEGIAQTAQARVEVRQYGVMIYSTLVPAGPFCLTRIPVTNLSGDLDVTVIESDGQRQHFSVPASPDLNINPYGGHGIAVAAGKLRQAGQSAEGVPALLTLNANWQLRSRLSGQSGLLLAKKYQSLAVSAGGSLLQGLKLAAQIAVANNMYQRSRAAQLSLSTHYNLSGRVSLGASLSKYSPDFVSLEEASQRQSGRLSRNNLQYVLTASFQTQKLGIFSFSHFASSNYGPCSGTSGYNTLNWNHRIKRSTLSVSLMRSSGIRKNSQLSVSLMLPLNALKLRAYYRSSGDYSSAGSQLDGNINDSSSYNLAVEQDIRQHARSVQGSINTRLHYTNLGLSASRNGPHSASYSLSSNGGMAMVGPHLLFSPYSVGDTFGMIALNEKMSGVAFSTPSGVSWTDWRGQALIAELSPWSQETIQLKTDTLPKSSDVSNGVRKLNLARGSVSRLDYKVLNNRRVLLQLRLKNGQWVPRGSLVWSEQGSLLAAVVDEGTVYLDDSAEQAKLAIEIKGEEQRCHFSYQLDSQPATAMPYQRFTGVCS